MSTRTIKYQIGNYFYKMYRVPLKSSRGKIERFKNGQARLRHVKSLKELISDGRRIS